MLKVFCYGTRPPSAGDSDDSKDPHLSVACFILMFTIVATLKERVPE